MNRRIGWLVAGLSAGLLAMGALRWSATHPSALTPLAGFATPGYIAVVVFFTFRLIRAGLPLHRVGFEVRPGPRHLLLAFAAIVALRIAAVTIEPFWESLLGGPRNLERFADVRGSPGALAALLAMSWSFAAFGEEVSYRIVLMRGLSFVFGDTHRAKAIALVVQAVLFGIVHAYQGPTGVAGAATSGLVFGAVTLAGGWSIWPAAIAHGVSNTFGILELYRG